ncbi:mRNA surveillance protein pelota [Candidatus Micrarchaeota archaeon]|nr:mRNA surveillance protein pelota [Candidatus Micrarchaeota archaeon]
MKIIHHDEQEHKIKLEPQCPEDLWYLQKIIEPGDGVEGVSFRRFKSEGEEGESGEKKKVHILLRAEQVEFAENALKLRITGKIESGSPEEFAPKGAFHTLDIEVHERLTLYKTLNAYHWSILNDAKKRSSHVKAFLVVLDEHQATLAELQLQGLRFIAEIHFRGTKKDPKAFEEAQKAYFSEIAKALEGKDHLVIAGPGFAKDNLKKYLDEKYPAVSKKARFEYAASAEKPGVYELLKRGVIEKALGEQRLAKEFELMEKFKASVGRDDHLCAYGLADVKAAVEAGAASDLMISETLMKDKTIQSIMDQARRLGAELHVFETDSQPGAELKAFGLAALLRYPIWK